MKQITLEMIKRQHEVFWLTVYESYILKKKPLSTVAVDVGTLSSYLIYYLLKYDKSGAGSILE